jgi:hypothetical protein
MLAPALASLASLEKRTTAAPKLLAGKLLRNFARTTPLLPWVRVTLPQITRIFVYTLVSSGFGLHTTWVGFNIRRGLPFAHGRCKQLSYDGGQQWGPVMYGERSGTGLDRECRKTR